MKLNDDRRVALKVISDERQDSVKNQLIQLQSHFTGKLRSLEWARALTCMEIQARRGQKSKGTLRAYTVTPFDNCHRYVAVSYCCAPARNERTTSGGYTIQGRTNGSKSRVRDVVLDRVTRFCISEDIPFFWIDKECIPPAEETVAKSVMDVIYRYSYTTIGLISASIESHAEALTLEHLLQQNYVSCHPVTKTVILARSLNAQRVRQVLQLLRRITADQWWRRCWTFQEEYVSHGELQLLIPTSRVNLNKSHFTQLKIMVGEVAIRAADFRRQTTLFCIAVWNHQCTSSRQFRSWCRMILRRAQSYQALHQYRRSVQRKAGLRAMSASLYADLCCRGLADIGDLPSILANCCGYTKVFVRDSMKRCNSSVSLTLLACFLTNGELLNHRCRDHNCMSHDIATFLTRHSFEHLLPPTQRQELTFTKRCRIPHVVLLHDGIRTRGHLWHVVTAVDFAKEPSSHHFHQYAEAHHFTPFQRARLCQIVTKLRGRYPHLSSNLHRWILETPQALVKEDPRTKMMVNMAIALCQAVKNGRKISIALSSRGGETHGALFANSGHGESRLEWIFTSWNRGEKFAEAKNTRAVENYVSLHVESDQMCAAPYRWISHSWVNGLCFFTHLPQENILFAWPKCFQDG